MAEHLAELNKGDLEVYSTTEKQVGIWIDGKPLYEVTLHRDINVTAANTWYVVGTLPSNTSFAFVTSWKSGTYTGNTVEIYIYINDTTKEVNVATRAYTGQYDTHITVRYTKS